MNSAQAFAEFEMLVHAHSSHSCQMCHLCLATDSSDIHCFALTLSYTALFVFLRVLHDYLVYLMINVSVNLFKVCSSSAPPPKLKVPVKCGPHNLCIALATQTLQLLHDCLLSRVGYGWVLEPCTLHKACTSNLNIIHPHPILKHSTCRHVPPN